MLQRSVALAILSSTVWKQSQSLLSITSYLTTSSSTTTSPPARSIRVSQPPSTSSPCLLEARRTVKPATASNPSIASTASRRVFVSSADAFNSGSLRQPQGIRRRHQEHIVHKSGTHKKSVLENRRLPLGGIYRRQRAPLLTHTVRYCADRTLW